MTCIRSAFTNDVPLDDAARWRGTRSLGGGGILDRAVHEIDLWRHLLDDDVAEVSAYSVPGRTEDDVAIVTARMRRGALATIVVLDSAVVSHELTIYGSRGDRAARSLPLRGVLGRGDRQPARLAPARGFGARRACSRTHAGSARAIRRGGDFMLTYEDEWRRFAEIVRDDLPAEPSVADGRAALEWRWPRSPRPTPAPRSSSRPRTCTRDEEPSHVGRPPADTFETIRRTVDHLRLQTVSTASSS